MGSLGFCNLNEAFNMNNNGNNNGNKKKSKKKKNILDGIPGTIDSTFINSNNRVPTNIYGTTSTIPASTTISNENINNSEINNFENINENSILTANINNNSNIIDQQIKELNKKVEELTLLVHSLKGNNINNNSNNLIESFTNNDIFKFDNYQCNELLLFIFLGILIILLFDYIYKLGKKSY